MLIELASVKNLLREFDSAVRLATQAVEQSANGHKARSLAFQNLGRALFELGQLGEAQSAYLQMIDAGLRYERVVHTGIASEWLARIAVRNGNLNEAGTWHDIAREVYLAEASQYLASLADILQFVSFDTPRAPLDSLPFQAKALCERLPEPSEVGDRAGIHLDTLNVDLGALRMLADVPGHVECSFVIPLLTDEPQTYHPFSSLIVAESRAVIPHAWALPVVESILREIWPEETDRILEKLGRGDLGQWALIPSTPGKGPTVLTWSGRDGWLWSLGTELQSLAILLQAAFNSRRETRSTMSAAIAGKLTIDFVNFADRASPRPIQSWMIAQGQAAAGGEMGPACLAEDAARRRILSESENLRGFAAMHYPSEDALQLHQGGLVALRATELMVPGGAAPRHIGTTPLNEVNIANPPSISGTPDMSRPGFVIDREYNTWFFAPSSAQSDKGWYGTNNALFRDHFSAFHTQVEIAGSLRAKHYAVPVIDIHSAAELTYVGSLLEQAVIRLKATKHVRPDARVWYRGQTRGYLLNRPELVARYLFGRASVDEPSLQSAAPRRGWNYMKVHSFFSVMLQALLYRQGKTRGETVEETHSRWREFALNPGKWDLGVMLLAQHYGVPTHGIDITSELDGALWFATNRYSSSTDGTAYYSRLPVEEWAEAPSHWPLIYAIVPVTHSLNNAIRDVDLLKPLGINALRPRRQHAAFFLGAHGLHRNRLAEALVCVLRLSPGNWDTKSSFAELFPSEHEDPVYAWMLDLKARYTNGEIGKFLKVVPRYAQSET